jgi:transcriptional regulator with XRE-family HTH domain
MSRLIHRLSVVRGQMAALLQSQYVCRSRRKISKALKIFNKRLSLKCEYAIIENLNIDQMQIWRKPDVELDSLVHALKRLRKDAGLEQLRLAELAGIEISRLSRIENGKLRPTEEEVMSILEAVDTEESRTLAKTVGQTLQHFQAPTWNVLGANDRSALLVADTAITKLESANVPKSLKGHVENLKQSLFDAGAYLINPHHPICMIGHIGVGKSSAGNAIFGLSEGFGKHRRRAKESGGDHGLLPTGGGGTTAFEFRVAYAHEPSIRIEPQREDKILADVRELCEFWVAEGGEKRDRAIPTELERVYRNMAGLGRTRDVDPVRRLINPNIDAESLFLDIAAQMNLSRRTRTELLYREDREPDQSEADWLQKRCDALNLGKLPDCPLPRRLDIGLPNPALKAEGFRFTLLDLRGINTTDPRPDLHPDLVAAYSDPRALLVLCSNFLDAPDNCALSVIEHLKKRSASNVSTLDQNRVTLLVLPHNDQATSVRRDDGSDVDDREEGYDLKSQQIASRISDTVDKLALRFFDARRDEPEPIRSHILNRLDAMRDFKRKEIVHFDGVIDSLIDDIGQTHFEQTQSKVREKISAFLKQKAEQMDLLAGRTPTWIKLVREVNRFHASSVWSIARGNGEGRSIDLYQVFAELFREDAKERTTLPTTELKTLLKELLHDDDMQRREMKRSKSFVAEVIAMTDRQQEAFLQAAGPLAQSSLKQVFKQDDEFWTPCASRWGQGPGFRSDIADRIENWFESRPRISARLEAHLQGLWDDKFVNWLRSYMVKA